MKKSLMIIGGVVVGVIIIVVLIFIFVASNSKKLVCKSPQGNITIMYNDKTIVGYTTLGDITFDMEQQNTVVETIGISNYIEQFTTWFSDNTDGECE